MRIHYLALHEPSGYAVAARRCMLALAGAGAEVRFVPFVPGHEWGLGYRPAAAAEIGDHSLRALLAGPEVCDAVVAHLVPEYWPQVRALYPDVPLVGHTVWETDRLPATWPALLGEADLIVVPTQWNRGLLERSDIRAPIAVVPHIAAEPVRVRTETWSEIADDTFVVYSIGPWSARKALDLTVRAYQSAFAGRRDTLLVLKTSARDFTWTGAAGTGPASPGSSAWSLARVLGEVSCPAPVRLVTRVLGADDIDALHVRGDCYLSLCRSEGWGIPAFDAAAFGTPIVITGYGGQLEYLDAESAFLVDHTMVAVDDPAGGSSYVRAQHWAEPSVAHGAAQLGAVADAPREARARAERARARITREFAAPVVARAFADVIGSIAGRRG
jgi:glycosyltransferase involved in cell wall biosynthesis